MYGEGLPPGNEFLCGNQDCAIMSLGLEERETAINSLKRICPGTYRSGKVYIEVVDKISDTEFSGYAEQVECSALISSDRWHLSKTEKTRLSSRKVLGI